MKSSQVLFSSLVAFVSFFRTAHATQRPPKYPASSLYYRVEGSGEAQTEGAIFSQDKSAIYRPRSHFRINKARKGGKNVEEPIEIRAERFFERGGKMDETVLGDTYWAHENFFKEAYAKSIKKCLQEYPNGVPPNILKAEFMKRVNDYRHENNLRRGVEKYGKDGLYMSIEEYDMARKHFLNQNPPLEGSYHERQSKSALKSLYRKELKDPNKNREKVLEKMRKHNWTEEDIKPYIMPPTEEIAVYIGELRASRGQPFGYSQQHEQPSTIHVSIPVYRSNREEDFDLNHAQPEPEEDDDLNLSLGNLDIKDGHGQSEGHYRDEEDDDLHYNASYHNPYPQAYDGNFNRAYGGWDDVYGCHHEEA